MNGDKHAYTFILEIRRVSSSCSVPWSAENAIVKNISAEIAITWLFSIVKVRDMNIKNASRK